MSRYNVAVQRPGYCFLLSIEGFSSLKEAQEAIRWQREGDFHEIMYVVEPVLWSDLNTWRVVTDHWTKSTPHDAWRTRLRHGSWLHPNKGSWMTFAWAQLLRRHWPNLTTKEALT